MNIIKDFTCEQYHISFSIFYQYEIDLNSKLFSYDYEDYDIYNYYIPYSEIPKDQSVNILFELFFTALNKNNILTIAVN